MKKTQIFIFDLDDTVIDSIITFSIKLIGQLQ